MANEEDTSEQPPPQQEQAPPASTAASANSLRREGGGNGEKKEPESGKEKDKSTVQDIWSQLLEQAKNNKENEGGAAGEETVREASIVFIGPRHSGKSTMIHSYMFKDKEDTPKPTTSLDYKYTRSSVGMSMEKDLSHFWELGGGRSLSHLLDICVAPETLKHTLVVINVDLSRPSFVLNDCLYWIEKLRARVKACIGELHKSGSTVPKTLEQEARNVFGNDHEDLARVDLFEIPVLIVANKYDLIKDKDAELLKVMSKSLRAIAHSNGCGLLYASKGHKVLLQTFRSRISRHVLNRPPSRTAQIDYTKPLSVPAGCDSFGDIGLPSGAGGGSSHTMAWMEHFEQIFPSNDAEKETTLSVETLNLAAEPVIDQMLAQKNEDLKQLKRKLQLKRRMKAVDEREQGKK